MACAWNKATLQARFRDGLDDEIQDEIATHDLPHDFDTLIDLVLCVEGHLLRCQYW